ncbi:MAG: glycosyltransferase family 2 protein [Phycisphaerae bacterium]|jgi:glycosyltransferase involved in cell wall biosynthesis
MYRGRCVCVVVPAYNEELLIRPTVEGILAKEFIDKVVVVDDVSQDRTAAIVEELERQSSRVLLIRRTENGGVGAAIRTGYVWCRENDVDIAVVMAGDGQMDPEDLTNLLDPVVEDRTDYAKANRLVTGEAWKRIPRSRYLGNAALTFLTKIASGYWHVTDSQTGYTALNRKALHLIPLEEIFPRYGMPNDLLVTLNIYNFRVMDVPCNPIYGIGEKSGIKLQRVVFTLSLLLLRLFVRRMVQKYIVRDFHPLVLFYAFGAFILLADLPLIARLLYMWATTGVIPKINALAVVFLTLLGFQSMLFAMLFDMEANRELKGR